MANISNLEKNRFMLKGPLETQGYDWWWHSFTGVNSQTNEEKTFFIEYYFCNPKLFEGEVVLGQDPERLIDNKKPTYMMVKVGTWGSDAKQIHKFIPWNKVNICNEKLFITAEDFILTEKNIKGSVNLSLEENLLHPEYMCDHGNASWDLSVNREIAFNVGYGTSKLFRNLNAFEMYWHSEGMKTTYSGTIDFDGATYNVNPLNCYGYSDKNWGADFTSPWLWLSSNNLYSEKHNKKLENSVFSIGGGRPKVFGIPLNRKLLSNFYLEGKDLEFNFSKFWTLCRTEFDIDESFNYMKWYVKQKTLFASYIAEIECLKKDMLLINYESPNGKKLHNQLWNGGTGTGMIDVYEKGVHLDRISAKNIGCEYGEYDNPHVRQRK